MKQLLALFSLVCIYSCHEESQQSEPTTSPADTSIMRDTLDKTDTVTRTSVYAIRLSDVLTLSIQQWDSTINLERHLGKPLKQSIRKLDNADTFSGSFVKDLEYDGLKLQLFSPPQNGKTFWVQEIILINNKYKTAHGVTIGDPWQHVKQSYPSIQKLSGNDNTYYIANESDEKKLELELQNNKVKALRIFYSMN